MPVKTSTLEEAALAAARVDEARADLRKKQEACDAVVADAVNEGYRFREVAESTGRSVSWVQAAIVRHAGKTGERAKRSKK